MSETATIRDTCRCGKVIVQTDTGWTHKTSGKVDCYNAAVYVGFVATPADSPTDEPTTPAEVPTAPAQPIAVTESGWPYMPGTPAGVFKAYRRGDYAGGAAEAAAAITALSGCSHQVALDLLEAGQAYVREPFDRETRDRWINAQRRAQGTR